MWRRSFLALVLLMTLLSNSYAVPRFSEESLITYLEYIAPMVVGRSVIEKERQQIEQFNTKGLRQILENWVKEPGFAKNSRIMFEQKLKTSGYRGDIDFNLPGNLMEHIVAKNQPLKDLVTAEYCVNENGQINSSCDGTAPYRAGVLTMRGFLKASASRFNLHRATVMANTFLCSGYPMSVILEPPLERNKLIPMFGAETAAEAEGIEGLVPVNGSNCYGCHAQFAPHTQLFVKFNEDGLWDKHANGIQIVGGEPGRSVNKTFTSHLKDPKQAGSESSQFLGKTVANLREAALVLVEHPVYLNCFMRNYLSFVFRVEGQEVASISEKFFDGLQQKIISSLPHSSDAPTFADLALTLLSDEQIINSTLTNLKKR